MKVKTDHSYKCKRIQETYYAACHAMELDEGYREYLKQEILLQFRQRGKKLMEDLDTAYYSRRLHREFDRAALLFVATTLTNNFRSTVVVQKFFI